MTDQGPVEMRWLRLLEGLAATGLLVALFVVAVGPSRVAAVLGRAHPATFGLALAAAVVWLLAWSETLLLLFETSWPDLDGPRFRAAYLGGMGIRGLVPGGSVSGPAVLAYVVTTSTRAEPEGSAALTYLAELVYWLASVAVLLVGFLAFFVVGTPPEGAYSLLATVGAGLVAVGVAVGLGARRPDLVAAVVRRVAAAVRATVGRHSRRVRTALSPGAVETRLDRFFGAFGRLRETPRPVVGAFSAALLGWIANAVVLWLSLAAVGAAVPTYLALFVVPAGGATRSVSILPGGIGAVGPTMAGLVVLTGPIGVAAAGAGVLLYRLATFWFRLGIGAACLVYLGLVEVPARPTAGAEPE